MDGEDAQEMKKKLRVCVKANDLVTKDPRLLTNVFKKLKNGSKHHSLIKFVYNFRQCFTLLKNIK